MIDLFAFVSDKNQISHFSTDSLTFYNLLNYSPGSPYILINEVKLIETQLLLNLHFNPFHLLNIIVLEPNKINQTNILS